MKVAIFLAGQQGDIMSAMSVLKYKEELWGDCKIVWFAERINFDCLKYQDIEVKEFPRGFGYPEMVEEENRKLIAEGKEPIWEDWQPLMDENNHLNLELAKNYSSIDGITHGYFPAPHQMSVKQRHGLSYPECSKKVFGVPMDLEWHPVLMFSEFEKILTLDFLERMPFRKTLALETFAGSGQSILSHEQIKMIMNRANDILGQCNFIFVSHKYLRSSEEFPKEFIDNSNIFFAKDFTVRQCALIVERCDLLISVSSGITVAASAWWLNATPIIQYTGSKICSTQAMALGKFELITYDERPIKDAEKEFEEKLLSLLYQIKEQ